MVRCRALDNGTYLIQDVPVFSERFGFGDVVTAVTKGDVVTADTVVEAAGWGTYVLEPVAENFQDEAFSAMRGLEVLGCPVQLRLERFVSVGVSNRRAADVRKLLEQGVEEHLWQATVLREVTA